ncbi:RNA polymerase sigma factor [Spongiivirga sp. MCCC 1A20706]|uniref:RNA polymerase sigma factor n=1 Tax=Spongiivirga sp. MCCC 1A20706 TaxID=3160963 RepID=UPI003977AC24
MKLSLKVIQLYKNEAKLIKHVSQGNRKAQQYLYEKYAPKMLSVCRQYIKDIHKAEEVMLTAFMKVYKYVVDFKHEGSFEGWIRRIMVRECISFFRQRKQLEVVADEIEMAAVEYPTSEEYDVAYIQQLIDNLPEGYKVVFVMYVVEGYKHHEIADVLGISESTSKSQLFKARKMLQQQLIKLNATQHGTA